MTFLSKTLYNRDLAGNKGKSRITLQKIGVDSFPKSAIIEAYTHRTA
jgi:hypothetical protein